MREDDRVRLRHMIEAGELAGTFLARRGRTELDSDPMLLFAVVRAIEIIGEAAAQITDETRAVTPEIPWRAIVGMRNRIVHAYWDIDRDIVWKTATERIPAPLPVLRNALERGGQP